MASLIKNFLSSILPSENQWQIKLLQEWETIIGPLKARITLEKIQKDTLILGVYDSSWLQELYLLSPLILQTINKNLEHSPIKNLRFKQAEKKNKKQKESSSILPKKNKTKPLTLEQKHALEKILDNELRSALCNFLTRCSQENA